MYCESSLLHWLGGFFVADLELTKDQKKLLFLIGTYAHDTQVSEEQEHWFKDGPLLAAMYELTTTGVFETYDYAAMSILCLDGYRRFMNISREGIDDLNDLRELGLLDHLKISTNQYGTVTGYRLTEQGVALLSRISDEERDGVNRVIRCSDCDGELKKIECENFEKYYFHCPRCDCISEIRIFDIEDVSYVSKAKFLRLPYRNDHNSNLEE
jgi:phage FluMu protein Com